jgi:TolB-like protein
LPEQEAQHQGPALAPGAFSGLLLELARQHTEPLTAAPAAVPLAYREGQVVGRFELLREIGRGGFGVVFEARDRELGRTVAFKAVRAGGQIAVKEERLLREAEAAARLTHPNIVTLFDVGRSERGPYLVLELLEGQTLALRLAQGAVPLREAVRIAMEVARGLAHAHANGVIHRDLTPGNVFLCADGQVKVLDFGMAHAFGQTRVDGGTRAYMAPEQARGAPEDERTDVFALGVVLHQLLSRELPFADGSELQGPEAAPALELPEAPGLGQLVARMLSKDPVARPRHAGEVLPALVAAYRELERSSLGESTSGVRRRTSLPGFWAELKRRRVVRATISYFILSFALLQISEPLLHALHLPDRLLTIIVVLLGLGFPVTVTLAWIFDVNPGGITRTPSSRAPGLRGLRLVALLAVLGVVAAVPVLGWYVLRQGSPAPRGEAGATPPEADERQPPAPAPASIAVLPFSDMSPGKDQEYLGDGLAEEILNVLSQVEGLHVSGRTSSFSFKGKSATIEQIGRTLRVGAVLEGSVRKAGNRLRVTAQIVKVADGFHLWSQTFDRDSADVFAVQDEIARAVVEALKVTLLKGRAPTTGEHRAASPDAYWQFLVARQLHRKGGWEGARKAYQRALTLDPSYAPAWAGLAAMLYLDANVSADVATRARLWEEALAAAERAVSLAPELADGYSARGWLRGVIGLDWAGEEADLERALTLSPSDSKVMGRHSMRFARRGQLAEAIRALRRVTELDPLWSTGWAALGARYNQAGQFEQGRQAIIRALEIEPSDSGARELLVEGAILAGRMEEALVEAGRQPDPDDRLWAEAIAAHREGKPLRAQQAIDQFAARFGHYTAVSIAENYAWRGEPDRAFEWLARARAQRDGALSDLRVNPFLRSLHKDPRFKAFLASINLPGP